VLSRSQRQAVRPLRHVQLARLLIAATLRRLQKNP